MTGLRPKRSESLPPKAAATILMTWKRAQRTGTEAVEAPSWERRTKRKASVELPRVKTNRAKSRYLKLPSNFLQSRLNRNGPDLGVDFLGFSTTPSTRVNQAAAAGTAES